MDPGNPLDLALNAIGYKDIFSVDEALVLQQLAIEGLLSALDEMHKEVNGTLSTTRKKLLKRITLRHTSSLIVLDWDYDVVARFSKSRTKISANCVGPHEWSKPFLVIQG